MSGDVACAQSRAGFLEAVADAKPTPAGGSVAAFVGALAASLGVMGARLCLQAEAQQQLVQMSQRLHALVQADVEAYEGVSRVRKIHKESPERSTELAAALHEATKVPLEIAEIACQTGWVIQSFLKTAKPAVHSDLTVGMIIAIAAADAGLHTALVNMKEQTNQQLNDVFLKKITKTARSLEELKGLCYTPPPST